MLSVLIASEALTLPACRVRDNVFSASACSALHDVASALGRSKHLLHRGSPPLAATAARTDDTAVGCGNSGAATATYAGALSARLLPMKACQSMDTLPSAMPGCLVYC